MAKAATAKKDWLSKSEAAAFLGVSPRQIERREAQGYLTKRLAERRMGESVARAEYSRADCEALKAEKPNIYAREVLPELVVSQKSDIPANGAGKALAVVTAPGLVGAPAHVAAFWQSLYAAATATPPEPKPWLTLAEAVEYSGLPAAYLVAAARKGTFRSINVGTGAREFWRFNREGLAK